MKNIIVIVFNRLRLANRIRRCMKSTTVQIIFTLTFIVLLGSCGYDGPLDGPLYGSWNRVVEHAEFNIRDSAQGVVFQGKMWFSNGYLDSYHDARDLWSSADGVHWTKVLDETPYDLYSELVVYNGKLWAIKNSVWCSENGVDWVRVLENTPFGKRSYGKVVVHDGKMWQLGSGADVWRSTDGVNWTCAIQEAPFGDRWASAVAVFGGKLWLMGGTPPQPPFAIKKVYSWATVKNDVWSSIDGANWTLVTEQAPWKGRMWFVAEAYAGRLWVMSGFDNEDNANFADAWYTSDGVDWKKFESETWWSARHEPTSYVFDNSLWIVAGNSWPTTNDVWRLTATPFKNP